MKIFYIELSYIEPNNLNMIHSKRIINYTEKKEFPSVKELKTYLIELVDANIFENNDWLKDTVKPQLKEIGNKTYVQYNNLNQDPYYLAERYGTDYEDNSITIVQAEAYQITNKNYRRFIK